MLHCYIPYFFFLFLFFLFSFIIYIIEFSKQTAIKIFQYKGNCQFLHFIYLIRNVFLFCFQYIGRVGTVHRITERGDVRVQYDGCSNRWTFHPGALKKVGVHILKPI